MARIHTGGENKFWGSKPNLAGVTFSNPQGVKKYKNSYIEHPFPFPLLLNAKSNNASPHQEHSSHRNTIPASVLLSDALALEQVKL